MYSISFCYEELCSLLLTATHFPLTLSLIERRPDMAGTGISCGAWSLTGEGGSDDTVRWELACEGQGLALALMREELMCDRQGLPLRARVGGMDTVLGGVGGGTWTPRRTRERSRPARRGTGLASALTWPDQHGAALSCRIQIAYT